MDTEVVDTEILLPIHLIPEDYTIDEMAQAEIDSFVELFIEEIYTLDKYVTAVKNLMNVMDGKYSSMIEYNTSNRVKLGHALNRLKEYVEYLNEYWEQFLAVNFQSKMQRTFQCIMRIAKFQIDEKFHFLSIDKLDIVCGRFSWYKDKLDINVLLEDMCMPDNKNIISVKTEELGSAVLKYCAYVTNIDMLESKNLVFNHKTLYDLVQNMLAAQFTDEFVKSLTKYASTGQNIDAYFTNWIVNGTRQQIDKNGYLKSAYVANTVAKTKKVSGLEQLLGKAINFAEGIVEGEYDDDIIDDSVLDQAVEMILKLKTYYSGLK